jgi:type VI secretion system secreted protein VgrG
MAEQRQVWVESPLGEELLFRRMTGREELGRPFVYELDLLSERIDLGFENLLGQGMTVRHRVAEEHDRSFHGLVSRFSLIGRVGRLALYRAELRPWLWFLTRTANCRIFQEQGVPDIAKEVFREHGFSDFEEGLSEAYDPREYCVQYRESDFDFVSRLLEQEGIYYYFQHEPGKHTLVLADSYSAHAAVPGLEELPFRPDREEAVRAAHVWDWRLDQQVQPGAVALDEYDFERPRADLAVRSQIAREHAIATEEVFDYPGGYVDLELGERYARVGMEELAAAHERVHGEGDPWGLHAGHLFRLAEFPREDQNREYLVVAAHHELVAEAYETGTGSDDGDVRYTCRLEAMDSQQPFRPARTTPVAVVRGPQTAVVVGQSGEEIWTDKYGRVKVQFHWDRYGQSDDASSCWVRVSQNWAGKNWGGMFVPHVGHEVIVDFLEGDPDRPVVTGRVYNADNMPPEGLPGARTKSIIRDHGGNEIVMEGADGSQQIRLYSPTEDSKIVIGAPNQGNIFLYTGGEMVARIVGNVLEQFQADHQRETTGNLTSTVSGNESRTVSGSQNDTVLGDVIRKSAGKVQWEVGGELVKATAGAEATVNLSAKSTSTAGAQQDTFAGGKLSTMHGYTHSITRGWKREVNTASVVKDEATKEVNVKSNYEFFIGGWFKVDAGSGAFLTVGDSIVMVEGDRVKLHAANVEIKGTSSVKIESGGNIDLKPSGKVNIPKGKFDDGGAIKT